MNREKIEKSLIRMTSTALSSWKIATTEAKKMQCCMLTSAVMTTTFMIRFRKCL